MSKRKYSKCVRCATTIDITNQDIDLCNKCSKAKPLNKANKKMEKSDIKQKQTNK